MCWQVFERFDLRGEGTADANQMLQAVQSASNAVLNKDYNIVLQSLLSCSLLPGVE